MKSPLLALFAVSLVAAASARADEYTFKEAFERTSPFNATGVVTLENVNGSITVHTWDRNEILVRGEKRAKSEEELKLVDLRIDLSPSEAAIKVHLPKRPGSWWGGNNIRAAVHFDITVPATATLEKISTVNSSITVDGVRGVVNLSSVNGAIHADGLGSGARLHTVNGSIHAAFAAVADGQKLSFETVNGSIRVSLPKDTGADFDASVVIGRISCDFPLTIQGRHRHHLSGTIGDGRAEVRASSVNGSIHLYAL